MHDEKSSFGIIPNEFPEISPKSVGVLKNKTYKQYMPAWSDVMK